MTDKERDRLRQKQDRVLKLAEEKGVNRNLRISSAHPGSPCVWELAHCVYPEWEAAIDAALRYLEG